MQFLLDSLRRNRRRLRIEEIILLALRCLIVLVLAAMVARFTGCEALDRLPGAGSGQQSFVFVLDDSASMGQRHGEALFQSAKADLVDRIKALPQAATVAILLSSRPAPGEALLSPRTLTDREGLLARLADLPLSDTRTRWDEVLAAAGELFGEGHRRLYVYSDFRSADLEDAKRAAALKKQFAALRDAGVEVVALDYGRAPVGNLTIQAIEPVDKYALAKGPKGPTRLAVTVKNNGPTRVEGVNVKLSARFGTRAASRPADDAAVELPVLSIEALNPGQTRRLEFGVLFPEEGPATVTAELPADELQADNKATLALDVCKALRILVVDGKPDLADAVEAESFFLTSALDDGMGSYGNRCDVITVEGLASVRLDDYDLVVLANVAELPRAMSEGGEVACPLAAAMESYVAGGGGVAVFLGDQVNTRFYNDVLYTRGLSPLLLGQRVGGDARSDAFFRLDPRSLAPEPVLSAFAGDAAAFTALIRFYAMFPGDEKSAAPAAKPPRVLARFTDPQNSPAMVVQQHGKGTVLTFYSSASIRWNDWGIDEVGTFPAVMLDMVDYIARMRRWPTGNVGEPIVHPLSKEHADVQATIKTPRYPSNEMETLGAVEVDGGRVLRYDRAREAGVYAMDMTLPSGVVEEALFARNIEAAEGDLRPAGKTGLASALGGDKFTYIDRHSGAGAAQDVRKHDYTNSLVGLLLCLLALEVFLAQRFGHYT
jgi:hypothetical protein